MDFHSDSKHNSFERLQCLAGMNKKSNLCRSRSLTDCYKNMVSSSSGCDFDKIFGGVGGNITSAVAGAKVTTDSNKHSHYQMPISSDSGLKLTRSTSLSSIPGKKTSFPFYKSSKTQ